MAASFNSFNKMPVGHAQPGPLLDERSNARSYPSSRSSDHGSRAGASASNANPFTKFEAFLCAQPAHKEDEGP